MLGSIATAMLLSWGRDSRLRRREASSILHSSPRSSAYSGRAVGKLLVSCEVLAGIETCDEVKGSQPNLA